MKTFTTWGLLWILFILASTVSLNDLKIPKSVLQSSLARSSQLPTTRTQLEAVPKTPRLLQAVNINSLNTFISSLSGQLNYPVQSSGTTSLEPTSGTGSANEMSGLSAIPAPPVFNLSAPAVQTGFSPQTSTPSVAPVTVNYIDPQQFLPQSNTPPNSNSGSTSIYTSGTQQQQYGQGGTYNQNYQSQIQPQNQPLNYQAANNYNSNSYGYGGSPTQLSNQPNNGAYSYGQSVSSGSNSGYNQNQNQNYNQNLNQNYNQNQNSNTDTSGLNIESLLSSGLTQDQIVQVLSTQAQIINRNSNPPPNLIPQPVDTTSFLNPVNKNTPSISQNLQPSTSSTLPNYPQISASTTPVGGGTSSIAPNTTLNPQANQSQLPTQPQITQVTTLSNSQVQQQQQSNQSQLAAQQLMAAQQAASAQAQQAHQQQNTLYQTTSTPAISNGSQTVTLSAGQIQQIIQQQLLQQQQATQQQVQTSPVTSSTQNQRGFNQIVTTPNLVSISNQQPKNVGSQVTGQSTNNPNQSGFYQVSSAQQATIVSTQNSSNYPQQTNNQITIGGNVGGLPPRLPTGTVVLPPSIGTILVQPSQGVLTLPVTTSALTATPIPKPNQNSPANVSSCSNYTNGVCMACQSPNYLIQGYCYPDVTYAGCGLFSQSNCIICKSTYYFFASQCFQVDYRCANFDYSNKKCNSCQGGTSPQGTGCA